MRLRNGILLVIGGMVIIGAILIALHPTAGEFDAHIARHINRLCGHRSDCEVYLMGLTKDDRMTGASWDTYYEFGPDTSDEAISKIIGAPFSKDHDLRRVTILMRGHTIVYSDVANDGIEMPLAGEVTLACKPFDGKFTSCPANALLKVATMQTQSNVTQSHRIRLFSRSGTAYFLTQIN